MIAIIDYNTGNVTNAANAFARAGAEAVVTRDPAAIRAASGIYLPGVGAFETAMRHLREFDLIGVLTERKEAGLPILGVCLGMQVLFEVSSEGIKGTRLPPHTGLGFLDGNVMLISTDAKLPHMGWNQLHFLASPADHSLTKYLAEGDETYFVHSYRAVCPMSEVLAASTYGGAVIPAIVYQENVMGCQFHPEKSGKIGGLIIKAFVEMTA